VLFECECSGFAPAQIKGIRIVPQGKAFWRDSFDIFVDSYKKSFYFMVGDIDCIDPRTDIDMHILSQGYIAITPLNLDMTDYGKMSQFSAFFGADLDKR
jgi:5'-nucleotidase